MNPIIFLLQAKAFFLYKFGKVITVTNNDWINEKAKLDSERDQCTVNSFLINFLIK